MLSDLRHIDWAAFHFLDPKWFWLLIPLALVTSLVLLSNREKSSWKSLISEHLRPFMFSKSNKKAIYRPLISFSLAGLLGIMALAGPSWKKIDVPGIKSTANLVILMDLSWSMMTEDIQPNRLERAKLKVRDLMDADPRANTSLFVFAGTMHPVMTLTSDYKLITHHVDYLTAGMMPILGDDLPLAISVMDTVFDRFQAPSTLLLITDELEPEDQSAITNFVENSIHKVEILVSSTVNGGQIPGFRPNTLLKDKAGNVISSIPDQNIFAGLKALERVTINPLTLDDSDVTAIATRVRKDLNFQADDESSDEEWQNEGLLLVFPMLLLILAFFRKGYMIQWSLFFGLFLFSACSPESKYAHWWYSADYLGQKLEGIEQYQQAGDAYADILRKAVAYYKAGDYEASAALFSLDSSAAGKFNYGLSLANMGYYEQAQEVLEEAKTLDPDLPDLDRSISKMEDARMASDSVNRFDPTELFADKEKGELIERQASGKDEELTSDTEVDELPQDGNRVTDEVASNMRQAEELERPPEDMEAGADVDAQNIMLRTISAEPTEFLRRRFKFQVEKYYPDIKEGEKKW